MQRTTWITLAGLALGGSAWPSAGLAQRPDLAGRWIYNPSQSDHPYDRTQAGDSATDERRGERGRGGRVGGFGGGHGGFGSGRWGGAEGGMNGGQMSAEQRARMHQTMQLAFAKPLNLMIAQTDSTLTLTADTAAAVVLYGDGRKMKEKVPGGGDIETKCRWQGNSFVVERKVSGGGKVTEDYLRSQDGKQLFVIVSFDEVRGRSNTYRRIYDATGS